MYALNFLIFNSLFSLIGAQIFGDHLRESSERYAKKLAELDARNRDAINKQEYTGNREGGCVDPQLQNDCMNFECLCRGQKEYKKSGPQHNGNCLLPNSQWMQRAVRREYRTMNDYERYRFHETMWKIKRNGKFDEMARIYCNYSEESSAHSGPGFLPWHREFLKQFEFELRRVDVDVSIPYWDSTLDSILPDPRDSIIWTPEFMGSKQGVIIEGPFAGWKTFENKTLQRAVGVDPYSSPFTHEQIHGYLNFKDIEHALGVAPSDNCSHYDNSSLMQLEISQGLVHMWVGGHMKSINKSACDPIFYLLHSFVDGIWEQWRNLHQMEQQKASQYPQNNEDCFNEFHFANQSILKKYDCSRLDAINTRGLSTEYLDNLYVYEPRPECPYCGNSPYLFCMQSVGKCASKIRLGGHCWGLENEDACYNSRCVRGHCVQNEKQLYSLDNVPTLEEVDYEILLILRNSPCHLLDRRIKSYLLSVRWRQFRQFHFEESKEIIKKYYVLLMRAHCEGTLKEDMTNLEI